MCGIFCTIIYNQNTFLNEVAKKGNLQTSNPQLGSFFGAFNSRGPDSYQELHVDVTKHTLIQFAASVLWTQGNHITSQPIQDENGNVLLWNGDVFSGPLCPTDNDSDTKTLSKKLQECVSGGGEVLDVIRQIRGPFSFIYYDKEHKRVYYGRDVIGRHSLLIFMSQRIVTLCSVANKTLEGFVEVPAVGVFVFDMEKDGDMLLTLHPWSHLNDELVQSRVLTYLSSERFLIGDRIDSCLNATHRSSDTPSAEEIEVWSVFEHDNSVTQLMDKLSATDSKTRVKQIMSTLITKTTMLENVDNFLKLLRESVKVRIEKQPKKCKSCVLKMKLEQTEPTPPTPTPIVTAPVTTSQFQYTHTQYKVPAKKPSTKKCKHCKVGILFSGGLDSAVLAALCHEILPPNDCIDLMNVAFQVPQKLSDNKLTKRISKAKLTTTSNRSNSEPKLEILYNVPDRITGLQTLEELKTLYPNRKWNFVQINVSLDELKKEREEVISNLIFPLNTVLDDSLGCALWFACRGKGLLLGSEEVYSSPCRIILSGLGADEQFGGYMRHRTTLKHKGGWPALDLELQSELWRISERNLGRDDRISSSHGRQCRMPYLDEDIVNFLNFLPPWDRCFPVEAMPPGLGDKTLLRLVAWRLGFRNAANLPKRAMQFGSRIANSKEKGGDVSERL